MSNSLDTCQMRSSRNSRPARTPGGSMQFERLIWRRSRARSVAAAFLAVYAVSSAQSVLPPIADSFSGRPRVAIISDIGNEPDDQMSFVRLLLYSNELDLETIIASTSTWQRTKTHPETMHSI